MFLVYGGDKELVVNGYDASFDTDPDDSKSQTRYIFLLNGGAVSWCSSKKSVVAGSMCEAEYIVASEAANEGVWMKEFISDLGVTPSASGPMKIFCEYCCNCLGERIQISQENQAHQETLQFHPRSNQGGRHRDLQDTYGSECCRPVD